MSVNKYIFFLYLRRLDFIFSVLKLKMIQASLQHEHIFKQSGVGTLNIYWFDINSGELATKQIKLFLL